MNNLYERCKTSKAKVNHTKTVEAALTPGASEGAAASNKKNAASGAAGGGGHTGPVNQLERQRQVIGLKMECVGHYLADFSSIVSNYGIVIPGALQQQ